MLWSASARVASAQVEPELDGGLMSYTAHHRAVFERSPGHPIRRVPARPAEAHKCIHAISLGYCPSCRCTPTPPHATCQGCAGGAGHSGTCRRAPPSLIMRAHAPHPPIL